MARKHRCSPRPSTQLLALLAAVAPAAGMAQGTTSTTLPTVTVKEAAEVPYKAEKSANEKFTAPLLDTPKTVQIIKKEVIEEQGAVTLMEALRNTPGITMQMGENGNTSAGDTFQLRGFSLQQSIFVDGIRDLGAVTRDTFNLEQVEIVKGAAGAETGRGASSGFINLVSKQAHLGDESSVTGTVGTGDRRRASVDLNRQLSDTSAFRLNAMAQDSGVDGRDFVENKGYGLGLSYVSGLNTPTRVHLFSQHLRQDNVPDGGIPAIGYEGYTSVIGPKVRRENFYGSVNDREKVDADMFTVKVEHDLGEATTIRNVTRYGKTHMDRTLTGMNTGGAGIGNTGGPLSAWTVNLSRQRVDQENSILANQTSLNTEFNSGSVKHSLAAGVELLHEKQTSFAHVAATPATAPANLYNPDPYRAMGNFGPRTGDESGTTTNTISVYAFDNAELNERWSINGGARVDVYKLSSSSAVGATPIEDSRSLVSWSIGSVYKPAENGSVYASYATSSTPPGAFTQLSASATNINNPAFDPQKTNTVELGTKWDLLDKRLNVAAAIFRTVNDNQTTVDQLTGATVQEGKTQVQGIELSATGQITRFWQITAGLAKTSTKQIDVLNAAGVGTDGVRWSPDLTATLWTSYQWDKLTMGFGARYVSEAKRFVNTSGAQGNMPNVPSYWVADAMAKYQVNPKLSLQLNIYNLFDEEYLMALNNGGGRLALGAPRSATLTANYKF
ncbi:MAG: catecholate siderophore receptor Fiu [Hydrogenophaga sp.]|uniref:catecholate siderophore receptor Fiu n=1 Tax=Hydrogenophaga sp. TaxID=1904254 RepID=UPI0016990EA4|nr:catecholate siderophore receptor Fiu [Hydrogenophaga sp.]NIM42074.1 catecholate siderophore receptor Fiu [Hydrogenophaga sp.]NIN27369.1 catecholate siderophore receptor Fiu [Hydrogenophaga sp.]NIN32070.1 catecholate siderophore receptor Fiu [Hydrogenophaga sp.]NIN56228.1 catecholate siderophore receptor Fiu [Hydrogenophaga sp.]NIO52451.1 catecholate siderophore receptor Fiu [Hydrogenophaga sp.]